MRKIQWLSPDEQGEWDAFVTRHPLGLVYHLSAWQRVLEHAFRHIRGQFLVLRDRDGHIQAGLPVYTVTSWLLGNRTVSVPFATMCDPLISTKDQFDLLWPMILEASEKSRSRRIEIRTKHIRADFLPHPLAVRRRFKHHYLPLDKPVDDLYRNADKSNIRRGVEKAKREGVVIQESQAEQDLRVFHAISVATRRRCSLPPMPFAFFQAIYQRLGPERVSLYFAIDAGKPVGGLLALKFKDQWTAEYSGTTDNAIRGISPLLYWETIVRAKNSGAVNFSFGRTGIDNVGLLEHKRRWATIEEDLTDFSNDRISTSTQDNKSGLVWTDVTKEIFMQYAPVPLQKWVGDFCYRHLG